ncbi:30S ribosomal protein S16 [Flavobacteriales bacterium]|nr:30S ribosomal protein S16 [Flavobacteriales bacterium]MDB4088642.1 30S ribosomal protein S16 [Flavobacteriales bacterium]
MPVKIRLRRLGRKGRPFYHIVAADSRAPRDGKFLEKIGTYNPITNPASIDLDVDLAMKWLENGAQPTDTAKNILSHTGVMYKKHLLRGLKKGALTEEQVEEKFTAWLEEKNAKVAKQTDGITAKADKIAAERMKAETAAKEAQAAAIAAANTPEVEEAPADEAAPSAEEE